MTIIFSLEKSSHVLGLMDDFGFMEKLFSIKTPKILKREIFSLTRIPFRLPFFISSLIQEFSKA